MKKLLILATLVLLTACEPSKPVVFKYAVGDKVMMKIGIKGVVHKTYPQKRYLIRVLLVGKFGEQKIQDTLTHELEIEKKID